MDLDKTEGVYLIHTRELRVLQKNIYKFGRSCDVDKEIKKYPKNSEIIFIMNCDNSILCDSELIKIFKNKFIQKLDYGTKYFEGDKYLMIKEICNFIINNRNN